MLSAELRGTALVTGGGRGIGANIARELARAGMDVAVTGRTAAEVRGVAEEIGGRALTGDVSKRADVARWCGEVGAVDLLVNNAGISGPEDPLADVDEWWHTFEVNVLGTYMCCRAFAPLMAERGGGRIVNVASGSAYLPPHEGPNATAYPASKAAVNRFSEVLAASLAPQNVFVFSISPGLVRTAMTSAPRRRAVDAARVRAAPRARARDGRVRQARGAVPPRGARSAGAAARADGRDPRRRPERRSPEALTVFAW